MIAEERSSLELINARFAQFKQKKEELRKKRRIHRSILAALSLGFLCTLTLWFYAPRWVDSHGVAGAAGSAKRASITGQYRGILSPKEVEEWNDTLVQSGKIYVKLKTEIQVTGGTKAYIRLINPPYCAYDSKCTIADKDTGAVLYQSGTVEPGTVVEYAGLNQNTPYGKTPVCVTLQYCPHGKERVIKTKEIAAVLVTPK